MTMQSIIEVTTTCGSPEAARKLAAHLVSARLAACVQVTGPIESVYRWQGQVQTDQEWACTIKSLASAKDSVIKFIEANHSYEVPQILIAEVAASAAYAQWVEESVKLEA